MFHPKQLLKAALGSHMIGWYHWFLPQLAALRYGFPSRKLTVIGVTGTGGKSTVVAILAHLLRAAGKRVGVSSSLEISDGVRSEPNLTKKTMFGRFTLQKLLSRMVVNRCDFTIIETTSEGLSQHRHRGIEYDVAVFTNLSAEHIESHGSYEHYRRAKERLFASLARTRKPNRKRIAVVNVDDPEASHFLRYAADEHWGFTMVPSGTNGPIGIDQLVVAEDVTTDATGGSFRYQGVSFTISMLGRHNLANTLAAVATGAALGLDRSVMSLALRSFTGLPGRLEEVPTGRPFRVFVDYAFTPAALEGVYRTITALKPTRIIALVGSAGGGRDVWKRPVIGELAGRFADVVFVANEDPYDEDPMAIINAVAGGVRRAGKVEGKNLFRVLDRQTAIDQAIAMAGPGDIVVCTGKGAEPMIMGPNMQPIPWSETQAVRRALGEH